MIESVVLGDCILYLGDCLDVLPTLPAGSVDAVVTDPPYGMGKYVTDREIDPMIYRSWIGEYGTLAIFGYPELLVKWCVRSQIIPNEWVTWWPTNNQGGIYRNLPKEMEAIAIFGETPGVKKLFRKRVQDYWGRKMAQQNGLNPELARLGDVWRDATPGRSVNHYLRNHPNEKPISIMKNLIILCSLENSVILDPFMGSGTTGVACVQTGRKFIGIEIDPHYFEIAVKRIKQAQLQIRMEI